jgi:hypothetical protein
MSKELPREKSAERKERIGKSIGRHFGQTTEKDAKDHHQQKGLKHSPGDPEDSLLIPNLNVSPDKEIK